MPLFYFSTADSDKGGAGVEYVTAEEACREARRALRTMFAEAPLEVVEMTLTVLDEHGRVLQRATLRADLDAGSA